MRIVVADAGAELYRIRARHHLPRADLRAVRPRLADRDGGGEAVIVFGIAAAVLAVAAIVYLVIALVAPERF